MLVWSPTIVSRSQKRHNNVKQMLSMVYFHCKTIRNAANITAKFEKSRRKISHFRPQKSEKKCLNLFIVNEHFRKYLGDFSKRVSFTKIKTVSIYISANSLP